MERRYVYGRLQGRRQSLPNSTAPPSGHSFVGCKERSTSEDVGGQGRPVGSLQPAPAAGLNPTPMTHASGVTFPWFYAPTKAPPLLAAFPSSSRGVMSPEGGPPAHTPTPSHSWSAPVQPLPMHNHMGQNGSFSPSAKESASADNARLARRALKRSSEDDPSMDVHTNKVHINEERVAKRFWQLNLRDDDDSPSRNDCEDEEAPTSPCPAPTAVSSSTLSGAARLSAPVFKVRGPACEDLDIDEGVDLELGDEFNGYEGVHMQQSSDREERGEDEGKHTPRSKLPLSTGTGECRLEVAPELQAHLRSNDSNLLATLASQSFEKPKKLELILWKPPVSLTGHSEEKVPSHSNRSERESPGRLPVPTAHLGHRLPAESAAEDRSASRLLHIPAASLAVPTVRPDTPPPLPLSPAEESQFDRVLGMDGPVDDPMDVDM